MMGKLITVPLMAMGLSAATQAQTMKIEGRVYAGVEAGCCLLDDIYTGTAFDLYGVGHDLCGVTNWAVAWGYPRDWITFCMQGIPFDVTSYQIGSDCGDGVCDESEDSATCCEDCAQCCNDGDCDDSNLCTQDHCNQISYQCDYAIIDPCCPTDGVCYDDNPCTEDWSCDGAGMCNYPPTNEGAPCGSGPYGPCGNRDTCQNGNCLPECPEPCPAENSCQSDAECGPGMVCQSWTPGLPCLPSLCDCDNGGWRCTADCAGQCIDDCGRCRARIVNLDLHLPNIVEVCVSNASACTETSTIKIELDGPTCRWNTQFQLTLAPGETRCVDAQASSQCYFDFGLWCVQAELLDQFGLCDVDQECRDFCSGPPPPPMNVSASDGEYCEGVLVTWNPVPGASLYEVYRNWLFGSCGTFLGYTGANWYFHAGEGFSPTFRYSVRAITRCGPSACSNTDNGHRGSLLADSDGDCDVDLDDHAVLAGCVRGPDVLYAAECEVFAADRDEDIDLIDVAAFQRAFTGP